MVEADWLAKLSSECWMVMCCLYLPMNTILVVENAVTTVLGFCAKILLIIDEILLREELMASEVNKTFLWGYLKRNLVGAM